jgi:putative peptidoglycan lipid II flippase
MHSKKNYLILGAAVAINLLLQFLFQWYIIIFFGAGTETDAFFGAMALPQFILMVLSGSLTMVLIPLISNYSGNEFLEESWNYFQAVGILFTIISILLLLTSYWWVGWILPGFKGENFTLSLNLARIQLVGMLFSALLSVLWAAHSAKGNFVLIETTSIIANSISFVALLIISKYMGIYAAAWLNVLRVLLQVLFLMKLLGPYRSFQYSSPTFKIVWKKLQPLIAGNLYFKTDMLVDRYLTSTGVTGQLTIFNLAQQLYMIASGILSKVLINTIIPSLSISHQAGEKKTFYSKYKQRFRLVFSISVLVYLVLLFFGRPLLKLLFSYKNFPIANVNNLWLILVCLFGFWFGGLLGVLTSGTFYAKGDTKTPTFISVVLFTAYIPTKIYIFWKFGIIGLALSVSIYYLSSLILQMVFLYRQKILFTDS